MSWLGSVDRMSTSASMRPRQSSLGIQRADRRRSGIRRYPSFNEAEAIKPRNPTLSVPTKSVRATIPGFNEAEAIKPRNLWVVMLKVKHERQDLFMLQ